MSEQREYYNVDPNDLAGSIAYALNKIADRLDQLEGLRGAPTFYQQVFNFPSDSTTTGTFQLGSSSASFTDTPSILDFTNANHSHENVEEGGLLDHGAAMVTSSLADDDHPGYPWAVGRAGGQSQYGGTAAGEGYFIGSTYHATKGIINLGNCVYVDETNGRIGIGASSPQYPCDVNISNLSFNMLSGDATAYFYNLLAGDSAIRIKTANRDWMLGVDNSADEFIFQKYYLSAWRPAFKIDTLFNLSLNDAGLENGGLFKQKSKIGSDSIVDTFTASLERGSGSGAAGLGIGYLFRLENSAGAIHDAGKFELLWVDATDGSEDSRFDFKTYEAGLITTGLSIVGSKIGVNISAPAVSLDVNGGTRLGDSTTNYTSFSATGLISFLGSAGFSVGAIYAYDAASTVTISGTGIANKVQVTAFDTNGPYNGNITPDHTNDHLTAGVTGLYFLIASIIAESSGGTAIQVGFSAFKNNGATELQIVHGHRDLDGGGGDAGSITIHGLVDLTANDTVELWCWNETNTDDFIVDDVTLTLIHVGG